MEYWRNDILSHHGILGQKWGIRRFQNKDGTYTKAGKKHYGIGEARKKPKHYTRYLNDLDKAITYNKYDIDQDFYGYNATINRLNKKASKKELSERKKAKLKKAIDSKKYAESMINKGNAEVKKNIERG